MGVSRECFEGGLTYEQYKESMTVNREQLETNERRLRLEPEDLGPFVALPRPINVLALAEDWCADVVANLPILGRIASECGKLNLRVFPRDKNMDIMNQYLNKGMYQSIPTFVFFDDDFRELAVWIERPASVTSAREEKRRQLYAQHPEFGSAGASPNELSDDVRQQIRQGIGRIRSETTELAEHEVVRELREIVEQIGKGGRVEMSSPGGVQA